MAKGKLNFGVNFSPIDSVVCPEACGNKKSKFFNVHNDFPTKLTNGLT